MLVKLKKREQVANGFTLLEFDTLNQNLEFFPGQFFTLTLINPPFSDNRGNSRFLGFTNLPNEGFIQMIFKNGVSAFKKSLLQIEIGTKVSIDNINGKIELPRETNRQFTFIAGGIGIAPIISIIRFVKKENMTHKISLIYVNSAKQEAPFYDELENYSKENLNFKFIPTQLIDEDLFRSQNQIINDGLYFIKGEPSFVITTLRLIEKIGVEANQISTEVFTGY